MAQPRRYQTQAQRQAAYRARKAEARRQELAAKGLPPLPPIPSIPGLARWQAALKQASLLLDQVAEEMETYYDERSERWQHSDQGETFQENTQYIRILARDVYSVPV